MLAKVSSSISILKLATILFPPAFTKIRSNLFLSLTQGSPYETQSPQTLLILVLPGIGVSNCRIGAQFANRTVRFPWMIFFSVPRKYYKELRNVKICLICQCCSYDATANRTPGLPQHRKFHMWHCYAHGKMNTFWRAIWQHCTTREFLRSSPETQEPKPALPRAFRSHCN